LRLNELLLNERVDYMTDTFSKVYFITFIFLITIEIKANTLNDVYNDLVKEALKDSYEYQKINEELEQKKSQEHTTFTKLLPQIEARLSKEFNPDQRELGIKEEGKLSLELEYPVYNKRNIIQHNTALEELKGLENEKEIIETELKLNIRDLFGKYIVNTIKVNYVIRSINRATQNYKYIEKGHKIGRISKLDYLRAKANLDILLAQLNQEILLKHQSKEAILNLLSKRSLPYDELLISKVFEKDVNTLSIIDHFNKNIPLLNKFKTLQQKLLHEKDTNRFIGLQFKKNHIQEQVDIIKSDTLKSGEWVDFDIRASLTNRTEKLSDIGGSKSSNEVILGAYLTVPLFSFGSSFSSSNEQHIAKTLAKKKRKQADTKLINSVYKDLSTIKTIQDNIEIQKELVNKNEIVAKLSFKSYQLKKSDLESLLTSEKNLLNSKAKLIEDEMRLSSLLRGFLFKLGESIEY